MNEHFLSAAGSKNRIAMLAIACGLFIFLMKLAAYYVSDSVALLSDAMESIVNVAASIMMYAAVTIASRSEDADHRYGHQKAENISALVEGVLIVIAALLILEASIGRLFEPVPFGNIDLGLIISLAATALNAGLAAVMLRASRRSRSMALEGDAKHLFSDVLSSAGVVIGLFIASVTGYYILDPLIALVVAALLIKMGIELFRKTSRDLMDSSSAEEEKMIKAILEKNDHLMEYHELKTRRSGNTVFMEVHICIDGDVALSEAHDISVKLDEEIRSAVPGTVSNIHIEDHEWCQRYRKQREQGPDQ